MFGWSLSKASLCTAPYRHVVAEDFYEAASLSSLLQWCEGEVPWRIVNMWYYQIYRCLLVTDINEMWRGSGINLPPVFSSDSLASLAQRVGTLFGERLSSRVDVAVNKMVPGQWIGVHNDRRPNDPVSYRMAVWLHRGCEGGETLVLGSKNCEDIRACIEPQCNRVWIFETSPLSYHAIRPVVSGVRYTVAYEFWPEGVDRPIW
jgi:hypothetical protein